MDCCWFYFSYIFVSKQLEAMFMVAGGNPQPRPLNDSYSLLHGFSIYEVVHVACLSLSRFCLHNDSPEGVLKMYLVNIQNFS